MASNEHSVIFFLANVFLLLCVTQRSIPCTESCRKCVPCPVTNQTHTGYCSSTAECQIWFVCTNAVDRLSTFCLCTQGTYYTGVCSSINELQVLKPTLVNRTQSSLTISWTPPTTNGVVFQIHVNGIRANASSTGGTVTNLNPGTQYNLSIFSVLPADSYYPSREIAVTFSALTLKGNRQTCNTDLECDAQFVCADYLNNRIKYCLCNTSYYYANRNGCSNLIQLRVREVTIENRTTNSISLRWTADNVNQANVTYILHTWTGKIFPASSTGAVVSNLTAGTEYNMEITSKVAGDSFYPALTTQLTVTAWTSPANPGPITSVKLQSENATTGRYVYQLAFGKSDGMVVSYQLTLTNVRGYVLETYRGSLETFEAVNLKPAQTYNYSIEATSGADVASEATTGVFSTSPIVPILRGRITEILPNTNTSIEVNICKSCVTDDSRGKIQDVLLIVCMEKSDCFSAGKRKRSIDSPVNYTSWSISRATGFVRGYRVTPAEWFDLLKGSEGDVFNYDVGSDTSCKDTDTGYCNGPLPSSANVKVLTRVCNDAGCTEASSNTIKIIQVPIEVKTFTVNGSKSIKANYSDSVVLHCEVTGSGGTYAVLSGPELSKFKNLSQNTAVIDETLANLTCQDSGRYFCWGRNGGGETGPKDFVDVNITCLVQPPPVYQGKPYQPQKMIEVSSEKNTTFQFVVYGYPEPTSYDLRIQTKSNSYSDVNSTHYDVRYVHQEPPFGLVTLTIYDENTKETITYVLGINSEKGRVEVTVEVVKVIPKPPTDDTTTQMAIGIGVGVGGFLIVVVIVVVCTVKYRRSRTPAGSRGMPMDQLYDKPGNVYNDRHYALAYENKIASDYDLPKN